MESVIGWASTFFLRTQVDGWVRLTAWASLIANSLLILTGGLVRLTGSGLGCPTWPRCTDESWTSTAEMGIHGAIEFGNRLLTFALAVVAILAFLAVLKMRRERRDFFLLTLVLGLGIPLQAVVGGITVITGLNPWIVGIHFMISAAMIYLAATYVNRVRRASLHHVDRLEAPGQGQHARGVIRAAAVLVGLLTLVIVYLGTLVTGTGPHSGDSGEVVRHTFDAVVITRFHAVPVYVLTAVIIGILVMGRRSWPRPVWNAYALVGAVVVFQAFIGFYQYFNGLPIVAVSAHLVGSALMVATVAFAVEKSFALTADPADVITSSVTDPTH
ncbi:COX15/CtaA family protein [Kocuria sp.]|uniref:COX15/CtaA family protein n=1 Tax=Kocuria sp. TaxID=1871328 RepID=UPI0026E0A961|nr:COX15/CtaA family protein [Kocuria sp.]MDO5617760.1 COX15/CtaA family protein [Kocuria sp.]